MLCNALNTSQICVLLAPQDSENCFRNFAKRKQSDAVFAGNRLLRMVIIDIYSTVINTVLGRVTRHPAGMHCPSWDDAFVSSVVIYTGIGAIFLRKTHIKNNIWYGNELSEFDTVQSTVLFDG